MTTPICPVCEHPITDAQDVTYDVNAPDYAPQHTDAFHTELWSSTGLYPQNRTTCDDCGTVVYVVKASDGYSDVVTPDGVIHTCPNQEPVDNAPTLPERVATIVTAWPSLSRAEQRVLPAIIDACIAYLADGTGSTFTRNLCEGYVIPQLRQDGRL